MNLEFLENVCQVLPSLLRYADKRDEADEMLTAALPLNTLAQPNAAAQTHPHSTHWLCTLHTREETDLFVLANKFTPTSTDSRLSHVTHRPQKALFRDPPLSYSSFWYPGVSLFSQWQHREQSTGGSYEAGQPHLCQTLASAPTAAPSTQSPPRLSPPCRGARCHGTDRPAPRAGWRDTHTE